MTLWSGWSELPPSKKSNGWLDAAAKVASLQEALDKAHEAGADGLTCASEAEACSTMAPEGQLEPAVQVLAFVATVKGAFFESLGATKQGTTSLDFGCFGKRSNEEEAALMLGAGNQASLAVGTLHALFHCSQVAHIKVPSSAWQSGRRLSLHLCSAR